MEALIFNGALDRKEHSTPQRISHFLFNELAALGVNAQIFRLVDAGIPLFDTSLQETPRSVERMNMLFRQADVHIWLTPLYHGSMTGVMKNCLDWLEVSAKLPQPYLTGKLVGMVCWGDGVQAMQGINAMEAVAKSLRAWPLPYSVPAQRHELFDASGEVSAKYQERFRLMLQLLTHGPSPVRAAAPY